MLAFLAMPIAFPRLATLAAFLINVELYVHVAQDDEWSLAASQLKEATRLIGGGPGCSCRGWASRRAPRPSPDYFFGPHLPVVRPQNFAVVLGRGSHAHVDEGDPDVAVFGALVP